MGQYSPGSRQLSVKTDPDVGSRTGDFLRRLYPQKTAEWVAGDTGISAATVDKWLERASVPGGLALLRLIAIYGPEFLATVMPDQVGWLSEAARAESARKLDAQIAALQERRARL